MRKTALYGILNELYEKSYSVRDDLISDSLANGLLDELMIFEKKGLFQSLKNKEDINNDYHQHGTMAELNAENAGPAGREYLELMEALKLKLNQKFSFYHLEQFKSHFSKLPIGVFSYDRVAEPTIKMSTVLHLNREWRASDGGTLRLYNPEKAKDLLHGILPIMGRFVIFLSQEIPQQETESHRERFRLVGQFYSSPKNEH